MRLSECNLNRKVRAFLKMVSHTHKTQNWTVGVEFIFFTLDDGMVFSGRGTSPRVCCPVEIEPFQGTKKEAETDKMTQMDGYCFLNMAPGPPESL